MIVEQLSNALMHTIKRLKPHEIVHKIPELLDGFLPMSAIPQRFSLAKIPAICVILDKNSRVHLLATMYLLDVSLTTESINGDTVSSYAHSLVAWLDYLLLQEVEIQHATVRALQLYRNYVWAADADDINGGPARSKNTVIARVGAARRFHEWGERNDKFSSPIGVWSLKNNANQSLHRSPPFRAGHIKFVRPAVQRIPRILSGHELQQIVRDAPEPYSLLFRWAVTTGLRRFELVNLTMQMLNQAKPVEADNNNSGVLSFETLRKGGRLCRVYIPSRLVTDTHWYIQTYRNPHQCGEQRIFLNSRGFPLQRTSVSKTFRIYADRVKSPATFHHLRHTYAVTVLQILRRQAESGSSINPLKTLQVMMGHASISSTEIYLRALDVYSDDVAEALDFLYGASL